MSSFTSTVAWPKKRFDTKPARAVSASTVAAIVGLACSGSGSNILLGDNFRGSNAAGEMWWWQGSSKVGDNISLVRLLTGASFTAAIDMLTGEAATRKVAAAKLAAEKTSRSTAESHVSSPLSHYVSEIFAKMDAFHDDPNEWVTEATVRERAERVKWKGRAGCSAFRDYAELQLDELMEPIGSIFPAEVFDADAPFFDAGAVVAKPVVSQWAAGELEATEAAFEWVCAAESDAKALMAAEAADCALAAVEQCESEMALQAAAEREDAGIAAAAQSCVEWSAS